MAAKADVPAHRGLALQVEAQGQYRPADVLWPERMTEPEVRYSFRVGNTDLWKSGNVTTGRGFLESVSRRVAELADDAALRERIAETKRRQIVELTGLQDRTFTHADELESQRRRLEEVNAELQRYCPDDEAETSAAGRTGRK